MWDIVTPPVAKVAVAVAKIIADNSVGKRKKPKKKKKRKNGKRTSDNGEDTKMMTLRTQMTTKSNMQRK